MASSYLMTRVLASQNLCLLLESIYITKSARMSNNIASATERHHWNIQRTLNLFYLHLFPTHTLWKNLIDSPMPKPRYDGWAGTFTSFKSRFCRACQPIACALNSSSDSFI